jgi:hypothetical protein
MLHVIKKLVQLRTIKKGTRSYIGPRAGRPCASDCVDLSSGVEWSGVGWTVFVCAWKCGTVHWVHVGVLEKLLVPQLVKRFPSFWILNVYYRVYNSPLYVYVEPDISSLQSLLIYKVVQIWPGQTVTCWHTNSPGHIWTTLYLPFILILSFHLPLVMERYLIFNIASYCFVIPYAV